MAEATGRLHLKPRHRPSRDAAQAIAFSWIDTKEVRSPDCRAYVLVNDTEKPVPENVLEAVRSYDVHPIPWSARDEAREELAA